VGRQPNGFKSLKGLTRLGLLTHFSFFFYSRVVVHSLHSSVSGKGQIQHLLQLTKVTAELVREIHSDTPPPFPIFRTTSNFCFHDSQCQDQLPTLVSLAEPTWVVIRVRRLVVGQEEKVGGTVP